MHLASGSQLATSFIRTLHGQPNVAVAAVATVARPGAARKGRYRAEPPSEGRPAGDEPETREVSSGG